MARAKNEGIDRSVVNSLTTTLNSIYFSVAIPEKGHKAPMSCLLQFSPGHCQEIQICAGEHGIQPVFIFLQAPVSDFSVPKLTFDDAKTVLQKIYPGKLSHGIAVVDCVLRARIGQVEPDLQQIHP